MSAPHSTRSRLVSLAEAADEYHCSVKTIRRMISRGEVTGYRIGTRSIRVDLNEFESRVVRPIPTGSAA